MPDPVKHSSSSASLIVGLAAAVILALGVGVLVYSRQPPAPAGAGATAAPASAPPPTVAAEPSADAAPSAAPAAVPAAAPQAAGAGRAPGGSSATAQPTSEAAKGSAPGAARSGVAGQPPDKSSLGGSRGTAGAPPPLSAQAMMRRGFVASRGASENVRGVSKDLAGFDARKSREVKVKRAPEIDGRIEFSTTPTRVRPGDRYHVRVSFVNEGKRAVDVKEIMVTTRINRRESNAAVKPRVRQIAPRQNEVIHEISGSWDKGTSTWTLEVRMMSGRLDVYRNELVWK